MLHLKLLPLKRLKLNLIILKILSEIKSLLLDILHWLILKSLNHHITSKLFILKNTATGHSLKQSEKTLIIFPKLLAITKDKTQCYNHLCLQQWFSSAQNSNLNSY
jgi:hypothetical protein